MGHKARSFFKRKRLQQLRSNGFKIKKKIERINNPIRWQIDKISEMGDIFLNNRTKERALFLDLDGTIAEFVVGKKIHRKIRFRPFYEALIEEMKIICDIYLYSFAQPIRIRCLWSKYFKSKFTGFFDYRFSFACKKSLRAAKEFYSEILMVDDTPNVVHSDSTDLFIEINRWTGSSNDAELLKLITIIKQKWNLQCQQEGQKFDH